MILNRFIRKEVNKFLLFGIINLFVTNLILQVFLLFINPILATFISQVLNTLLGFYLYGLKVFHVRNLKFVFLVKYLFLAFLIWNLNWKLIIFIISYGFSLICLHYLSFHYWLFFLTYFKNILFL